MFPRFSSDGRSLPEQEELNKPIYLNIIGYTYIIYIVTGKQKGGKSTYLLLAAVCSFKILDQCAQV